MTIGPHVSIPSPCRDSTVWSMFKALLGDADQARYYAYKSGYDSMQNMLQQPRGLSTPNTHHGMTDRPRIVIRDADC